MEMKLAAYLPNLTEKTYITMRNYAGGLNLPCVVHEGEISLQPTIFTRVLSIVLKGEMSQTTHQILLSVMPAFGGLPTVISAFQCPCDWLPVIGKTIFTMRNVTNKHQMDSCV